MHTMAPVNCTNHNLLLFQPIPDVQSFQVINNLQSKVCAYFHQFHLSSNGLFCIPLVNSRYQMSKATDSMSHLCNKTVIASQQMAATLQTSMKALY